MATTRIISMHINKGKSIAQCLTARLDYVRNPDKTEAGKLISSYACAPETADQEFLLNRNMYIATLNEMIQLSTERRNSLKDRMKNTQSRMDEIKEQRKAITSYRRTKDVYTQYKESGWSPVFYREHVKEIEAHKKVQEVYAKAGGSLPTLDELSAEFNQLIEQKRAESAALAEAKSEVSNLWHIKTNLDIITDDITLRQNQDQRTHQTAR